MIKKDEIIHKFKTFHLKFVHSPLIVLLSCGDITAICLPIDVNSIMRQVKEDRATIMIRVMGEKLSVMGISRTDGFTLLEAIAKRFDGSKLNLMSHLKKMESLTTENQLGKLSGEFHGYYRTLVSQTDARTINQNAVASVR